jgi:hypothetical protein
MKQNKLKNILQFFIDQLPVNNQAALLKKLREFNESGQCVPTVELLQSIEKAGASPKQVATILVGMDDMYNKLAVGDSLRSGRQREIEDVFNEAHKTWKSIGKAKTGKKPEAKKPVSAPKMDVVV